MADTSKRIQRTTLLLPVALHKQLRHLAIEEGRPFTALVIEALEAYGRAHTRPHRRTQ
ncbi:MAG: CopG family transcriptional regulator [Candidatus Binatia bacterium]